MEARDGEGAMGLAKAAREPNWSEIGIEQKVERVRETLLVLDNVIGTTEKRAAEALKMAKAHQHGAHGFVVMPVIEGNPLWDNDLRFDLQHIFSRLR